VPALKNQFFIALPLPNWRKYAFPAFFSTLFSSIGQNTICTSG